MTVSNIDISSILIDSFGKTVTKNISSLLEHTSESFNEKFGRKLIKKKAIAKSNEIIAAIVRQTIITWTYPWPH